MPNEIQTILYPGYAYNKVTMPGPTITAVSASANPTHAAGNTGYIELKNVERNPYHPMALEISFPGPFTPSGATGTAALTFTTTFSTDGVSGTGASHVSKTITFTAATGPVATVTTPSTFQTGQTQYVFYVKLPSVINPTAGGLLYIRVAWATVLTTITTMDYGKMNIALVPQIDSENTASSADIT